MSTVVGRGLCYASGNWLPPSLAKRLAMHAYDIKFSASAVEDGKQLAGNFYGVFDNDTQVAEYFRRQAKSLLEYADRLDEIVEERWLRLEGAQVGSD